MQFFQRLSTSQSLRTILALVLSLGFVQPGGGQRVGVDICSCAPSRYEFKFDFTLFCPPINITQGDAVTDTSCLVSPFQDQTVGDLVPIAVQEITVMELDQNLDNLFQTPIRGSFKDGDTWTYTSVAAQPGRTDPLQIPRGIQFNIVGINILEQPIINTVIITFSNSCQAYPVLIPGQYAGWVRFLDLEDPLEDYCPFTPDAPSAAPSPFTPRPTYMSMSMDLGMLDLLEDEFGLHNSECTESSSTKYSKKSRPGKSGKGGNSPKGSKKMGKGGAGKGGSSGDSSSMMTDSSLKSGSSSKGKGGKGSGSGSGSESGSGSGSRRLLRSKGSKRSKGDCGGKAGKGSKKDSKSGKSGKGSKKDGESGKGGKGSKKSGKGGKGGGSDSSSSSKGQYKISKKESSESRRFIL